MRPSSITTGKCTIISREGELRTFQILGSRLSLRAAKSNRALCASQGLISCSRLMVVAIGYISSPDRPAHGADDGPGARALRLPTLSGFGGHSGVRAGVLDATAGYSGSEKPRLFAAPSSRPEMLACRVGEGAAALPSSGVGTGCSTPNRRRAYACPLRTVNPTLVPPRSKRVGWNQRG